MPIEPKPDPKLFLTVAVCTRNQAQLLTRAVESVLPQLGPDTELLIVDNASTDETPQVIAALAANNPVIRLCQEATPGIPFARNAALLNARGRHILFFDHDELVEPGWLDAYRSFLKNPPTSQLGCVGGPYLAQPEAPGPAWLDPHYGSKKCQSMIMYSPVDRNPRGNTATRLRWGQTVETAIPNESRRAFLRSDPSDGYAIPYIVAREAVEYSYRTGQLLEDVIWEND